MQQTQVTVRTINRGQENHAWFVFESDHEDIEHLYEELADDGVIYGERLDTEPYGSGGRRRVASRSKVVLTKLAVVQITELQFELVDGSRQPDAEAVQ